MNKIIGSVLIILVCGFGVLVASGLKAATSAVIAVPPTPTVTSTATTVSAPITATQPAAATAVTLPVPATATPSMATAPVAKTAGFVSPVEFPIVLSANFAELRSNHFHSGVDIRTQGAVGKRVKSVYEGYVSRISVSPYGFGKALYIAHSNGTTSVYGHLNGFAPKIAKYVKEQQYKRESFGVDLYPPKELLPVKTGEHVAFSGNSGSSSGPHLHLDIRDSRTQHPVNIIKRGYLKTQDNIAPRFVNLYVVDIDSVGGVARHNIRRAISLKSTAANKFAPIDTAAIRLSAHSYFAVEVNESKNQTTSYMGVYSIDQRIDGEPVFAFSLDEFSFDQSRFVNAASLYSVARGKRNGVYRLALLPNNPLPIYNGVKNNGIVSLNDTKSHQVEIVAEDDNGNSSVLLFKVRRSDAVNSTAGVEPTGQPVYWDRDFSYSKDGLTVRIPQGALYESTFFNCSKTPASGIALSPFYTVCSDNEPLQKAITVAIKADLPERLRSKALVVRRNKSVISSEGGAWRSVNAYEGVVETTTRNFGTFFVAVDTIAPRITSTFKNGANLAAASNISLVISDNLSGIESFRVEIDGKWALFEYDAKSRHIVHTFDDERFGKGKKHNIKVAVVDQKRNRTVINLNYIR